MNEAVLLKLKVIVERAVQPVKATTYWQRHVREELLAHVAAVFEDELPRCGDVDAALVQVGKRFGEPVELSRSLQDSVPLLDRCAFLIECVGEVFMGLRRKAGVAVFVLALIFFGGWVRSYLVWDHFKLPSSKHAISSFEFSKGFCVWFFADAIGDRHRDGLGFVKASLDFSRNRVKLNCPDKPAGIIIIPHFVFVIPLTLLSTWLLRSKPRLSTPLKIAEPVSTDGT